MKAGVGYALGGSALPTKFSQVNLRRQRGHRDGWNKHHVVPLECGRSPDLRRFFASAREGGFSLHCFEDNGILLPMVESAAIASGLPLHSGPHPRYNDYVLGYLNAVVKPISASLCGSADAAVAGGLSRLLVRTLRKELIASSKTGTLRLVNEIVLPDFTAADHREICRLQSKRRFRKD